MAGPEKPVALITVFSAPVEQRVLDTIAAGPKPPIANWFVGTYGINKATAAKVAEARCKYAPVFCIQPTTGRRARMQRRLSKQDAGRAPRGRRGQPAPRVSGRRPARTGRGTPEARRQAREGLRLVAFTALKDLSGRPIAGDLQRFWEDLDAAALFFVGEEYPSFTGPPATAAAQRSVGHTSLLGSAGTVRRGLGQRYILGMTPGWLPFAALGGVVGDSPVATVNAWRNGFIDARIATRRPRGFAQFNFVNVRASRLEDAVRSLHHACVRSGQ